MVYLLNMVIFHSYVSVYQRVGLLISNPICSMYGIFTYIWVIFRANDGKYSIHGAYGNAWTPNAHFCRID